MRSHWFRLPGGVERTKGAETDGPADAAFFRLGSVVAAALTDPRAGGHSAISEVIKTDYSNFSSYFLVLLAAAASPNL